MLLRNLSDALGESDPAWRKPFGVVSRRRANIYLSRCATQKISLVQKAGQSTFIHPVIRIAGLQVEYATVAVVPLAFKKTPRVLSSALIAMQAGSVIRRLIASHSFVVNVEDDLSFLS